MWDSDWKLIIFYFFCSPLLPWWLAEFWDPRWRPEQSCRTQLSAPRAGSPAEGKSQLNTTIIQPFTVTNNRLWLHLSLVCPRPVPPPGDDSAASSVCTLTAYQGSAYFWGTQVSSLSFLSYQVSNWLFCPHVFPFCVILPKCDRKVSGSKGSAGSRSRCLCMAWASDSLATISIITSIIIINQSFKPPNDRMRILSI